MYVNCFVKVLSNITHWCFSGEMHYGMFVEGVVSVCLISRSGVCFVKAWEESARWHLFPDGFVDLLAWASWHLICWNEGKVAIFLAVITVNHASSYDQVINLVPWRCYKNNCSSICWSDSFFVIVYLYFHYLLLV